MVKFVVCLCVCVCVCSPVPLHRPVCSHSMTRSDISSGSVSGDDQKPLPLVGNKLSDQEKQDKEKSVASSGYKRTNDAPARYIDMAWLCYSISCVLVLSACSIFLLTRSNKGSNSSVPCSSVYPFLLFNLDTKVFPDVWELRMSRLQSVIAISDCNLSEASAMWEKHTFMGRLFWADFN